METEANKIKKIRTHLKLTQQQFADKCGVKQQLIAMMERGVRPASTAFKLGFLKAFGTDFDTQIVDPEAMKEVLLNETKTEIKASSTTNVIPIPLWHVKASAGSGEALPDYPEKDVMWFDSRWLKNVLGVNNPSNLAIIQAKGNSMDGGKEPIKDGDLLMVDESYKEPIHNQVFVVNLGNNDIVVKRISRHWDGSLSLESDNPEYPFIIPSKEATIIGKVVWNGNKIGIS